ncbi:MAG: tetratricopeptide repeat-containing sensor histidine kinase [Saonia sp.]
MSLVKNYFMADGKYLKKFALPFLFAICCSLPSSAQHKKKDSIQATIKSLKKIKGFSVKDTIYIDLLNELGTELRYYNTDSLLLLSQQALKYSKSATYKKGESESFMYLGGYYSDKGDISKAISCFNKALLIADEINASNLKIRILNNLAQEYAYNGDYAKAFNGFLKGIDLATKEDNKLMLSIMNENIANLYVTQKDYEQALVFHRKVKKINDGIGNDIYSAESMSNVASIYADMGKLDYAMFNVNKSIAIFEKHKIMDWLAYAYEIKGKVYLKQENYKWALYWYNQSNMLHQKLDDDRAKIDLYNGMAEAYLGQNKDSISEQFALKAFEISTKIKAMEGTKKCAKTLYTLSKNKQDYATALKYHEIFQKLSDTLSRSEGKKSMTMLNTKIEYEQQKEALIVANEKSLAKQQKYLNVAYAVVFVFIVVTILVRRNNSIQKKLNSALKVKKQVLEKREDELKELNETKTKLFSIIGHDLRGPIGALQGLLKLFKEGEIKKDEFLGFIPKLRHDVDHLSFTLNNLLSWGQTQMNGALTKPTVVPLENLVAENINLLSEISNGKCIKITNSLPENTLIWSDANQIDIVVRNLISNALKFTPKNGMVTIDAQEKNDHWVISVRDTGVGMDKITQEKIFAKGSNVTTYGTNNEKGTGLGLSLCKEMIEKNNGIIWVESILRKGSCFYFTLPKGEKRYQKTA